MRTRSVLSVAAVPIVALIGGLLTGCSSNNQTPDAEQSATSAPTPSAPTSETMTNITIEIDGRDVQGHLMDSATAQSLIEQLPLTLSFEDYGGQEKIARLPTPLDTADAPSSSDAPALTIGYYVPNQSLVLYYDNVGRFSGIVPIGTYENAVATRSQPDTFTATIRRTD